MRDIFVLLTDSVEFTACCVGNVLGKLSSLRLRTVWQRRGCKWFLGSHGSRSRKHLIRFRNLGILTDDRVTKSRFLFSLIIIIHSTIVNGKKTKKIKAIWIAPVALSGSWLHTCITWEQAPDRVIGRRKNSFKLTLNSGNINKTSFLRFGYCYENTT